MECFLSSAVSQASGKPIKIVQNNTFNLCGFLNSFNRNKCTLFYLNQDSSYYFAADRKFVCKHKMCSTATAIC